MLKKVLFFLLFSAISTFAQSPSVNSIGPAVVYNVGNPIPIVCNATNKGRVFWVSDATTVNGTYVPGGTFKVPVACVGTNAYSWISLVSGNLTSSSTVIFNNDPVTGNTYATTNIQADIQQLAQFPPTAYSTYFLYPTVGAVNFLYNGAVASADTRSGSMFAPAFGGHAEIIWSG